MRPLGTSASRLLFVACLTAICASAQQAHYQNHGSVLLPDDSATPGQTTSDTVQKICATKWGTDERFVTAEMKKKIYAKYGTAPGQGVCKNVSHAGKDGATVTKGCEIDHRVSREVGGADTEDNLWPQPYLTPDQPGAYQKDKLENWLHKQVCITHTMTLEQAQGALKGDWYTAYLKAGFK